MAMFMSGIQMSCAVHREEQSCAVCTATLGKGRRVLVFPQMQAHVCPTSTEADHRGISD